MLTILRKGKRIEQLEEQVRELMDDKYARDQAAEGKRWEERKAKFPVGAKVRWRVYGSQTVTLSDETYTVVGYTNGHHSVIIQGPTKKDEAMIFDWRSIHLAE